MFIFFLVLNIFQPLEGDDFTRFSANAFYNHDIIKHLISDYYHLTGRLSAQTLVYLFLNKGYPQLVYAVDAINAGALTIFVTVFYKIITVGKEDIPSKTFIIYLALFMTLFCLNNIIGQVLMKTIAIQYFWGISLLTFCYYRCITQKEYAPYLAITTGVIIGLYNEAIFMVCFVVLFYYIAYNVIKKDPINKSIILFLIPFFVGGVIMFTAPGSYAVVQAREHHSIE